MIIIFLHSIVVNRRSVGAGASAYGKNPDLLFPMVNETTTMAPVTAVTPNNNIQSARLQELYKTLVCLNVGSSANGNDPDKKIGKYEFEFNHFFCILAPYLKTRHERNEYIYVLLTKSIHKFMILYVFYFKGKNYVHVLQA